MERDVKGSGIWATWGITPTFAWRILST